MWPSRLKREPMKHTIMGVLLLICAVLSLYVHGHLGIKIVYTHFFYIPIMISGLWYQKKAVYIALLLGILHITADFISQGLINTAVYLRVIMFVVVALAVGLLSEKRQHLEQRLSDIIEFSPDAMLAIDLDGKVIVWNHTMEEMTGIRREEIIGKGNYEYAIPFYGARRPILIDLVLDPDEELEKKYSYISRKGNCLVAELDTSITVGRKEIFLWAKASPMYDSNRNIIGAIESMRNITNRKLAENSLREYTRALELSNEELEKFAYVASHDLQEPLRMVVSYVQLLARRYKGKLDDNADDFINYAVDGAKRMQVLINDLLAYSRTGTQGKDFEEIDCGEILDYTLTNLRSVIERNGTTITHGFLPNVMADKTQFRQLLQNLISNAIKFRSEEPPHIHISAERTGEDWLFSMRDNGIGIDPEYNERIFEIFQRLHGRKDYPGTGIGLAICKKIVERHGGRIWVDSQIGEGSTFNFTIPGLKKYHDNSSSVLKEEYRNG